MSNVEQKVKEVKEVKGELTYEDKVIQNCRILTEYS